MLGIVHYLRREDFISHEGQDYIPYRAVVLGLGISSHINQLQKRRAKYPAHFVDIEGVPYISLRYAILLERFHRALAELEYLKNGGHDGQ